MSRSPPLISQPAPARRSFPLPSVLSAYGVALALLAADQGTKFLVHEHTPYGWVLVLTAYLNLVHAWNYGAAFSFLADAGGWQRYFFAVIALIVSAWLAIALKKPLPWRERAGYALVLGGALGNGLDRFARGYVVDFLDFHAAGWHWPAFNLADIGIVLGATLILWQAVKGGRAAYV